MAEPRLLLDTHVWLPYMEGDRRALAPAWVELLEQARADGRLLVSVMSVWEVAMLEARRRIRLSMECGAWVDRALSLGGLVLAPLDAAIAVVSTRLAGVLHRDPVDHILIATALLGGATLVTRDRRILEYARAGHVRAMDAGSRRIRV